MVMHTINSSTKNAEAGASPILGQLQLHSMILEMERA